MLAGYEYLFTEKALRLFLRGRTIKTIKPVVEDDEPIEIHFTDGYKIKMKHKPRSLGKGVYTPYFTVEVIKPDGQILLQEEIGKLNRAEGKLQPLKKEVVKAPYVYKRKDIQGIRLETGDHIKFKMDGIDVYDVIHKFLPNGLIRLVSNTKLKLIPKETEFLNSKDTAKSVRLKKAGDDFVKSAKVLGSVAEEVVRNKKVKVAAVKLESKVEEEEPEDKDAPRKRNKEKKADREKRLSNEYQNLCEFILNKNRKRRSAERR